MATHSSTLAWRIPWREEPGRLQSMGSQRVDTTEQLHFHFHCMVTTSCWRRVSETVEECHRGFNGRGEN